MAVGGRPISMGEPYSTDGLDENYFALAVGIVYQAVTDYSEELAKKKRGAEYSEWELEQIENYLYTDEWGFLLTDKIRELVERGEVIRKMYGGDGIVKLMRRPLSYRHYNGRKAAVFDLYNEDGTLAMSGTAEELSGMLGICKSTFYNNCKQINGYRFRRRAK